MIERASGEIPLSEQTDLLSLSRSSLYYTPRPPDAREVAIKHRMDALFTHDPCLGARRLAFLLGKEGMSIDRKTARAYMMEMGLEAIYPKPNLSKAAPEHKIYPYLLRGVPAQHPNHIWGVDITYIVRHEVACKIVMRSIPDMTGCPITRTLRGNAAR